MRRTATLGLVYPPYWQRQLQSWMQVRMKRINEFILGAWANQGFMRRQARPARPTEIG